MTHSAQIVDDKEHLIERIAAVTSGILYLFDTATGDTTFINRSVTSVLGFAPEEIEAMGAQAVQLLMHPDDAARFKQHIRRVIALGHDDCADFEYRLRNRAGKWCWLASRDAVFSQDKQGTVRQLIGVATDISERKVAQKAEQKSAAILNSLIASAPVGIVLFDTDMRYLLVNELLAEMNGLPVSAHLGKTFEEVMPDLYGKTSLMFRSVLASGTAVADVIVEGKTPKAPDVKRIWRVSSFPVMGPANQPDAVGAIVQEITEQRHTEKRLRAAEAKEKKAHEQVAHLMENLIDGICVFDQEFRFIYVNAAGERINNLSRQQLLGKTQWEVFPESIGTALEQELRRAMAERVTIAFENHNAPSNSWYELKIYPPETGGLCVLYRDITEAKRDAKARQRADERLRRVFETQTVGMIEWDFDRGVITSANSHFLKMLGYTEEDVAGGLLKFRAMTPPESTARNEAGIAEIRRLGRAPAYEKEYLRKDGSRVPVMIAGVSFQECKHEGMSVVIDLTAAKQAEADLRATEGRFRAAVGLVSSIVWTSDARGMMTGEQASWAKFTGQDQQSYQGHGWFKCVHPDDTQPTFDAWKQAVQEMKVFEFEHRVCRRDNKWRICSVHAVPVFDNLGKLVEWVGVHTDITKQRQAQTKVKASEVRYRRLFESAKDGILILDAHTATITDANPFIAEMLGYAHEQFVGKELWQIGLFEDVEASKSAMNKLQEEGYIRYDDLPLKTQTGRLINVEFVSNIYREGGETVIQCNIRDITDRKRLEDNLREQTAELSVADRRKDEFLATLAHELRNPLAPIRNGLQIMRRAGNDPIAVDNTLGMMERQLSQMVHLVDDLLDVSRISLGKLDLRIQRIQLADVLDNAVETSRSLIKAGGHKLTLVMPPQPVFLDADMTRLGQVFSNLLNNAAKYSEEGGHIELTARLAGANVVVSVIDTGVGISPDMLPKIFEMFTQVDRSLEKAQGGLGIGLCLVKQLVELHKGSVQALSKGDGQGSEFVVVLPTAVSQANAMDLPVDSPIQLPVDVPAAPWQKPPVAFDNTANLPGQRRILVADDNIDSAASLAMFLSMLGNDVRTANDGLEAVSVATEFEPNVILLDIAMPRLNGYDACRRIKQQPWAGKTFIIALTGWGQNEDKRRSLEAGFDHHLVKPMDPAVLEALLTKLPTEAQKP